jgi:hypothetical protein
MIARPWLVLVGGFLGAGKTTLILAAARELGRRGLRSAAIVNDQGADLVDTRFIRAHGVAAGEVTGGCFCCRFSGFVEVAEKLREHAPDVIFAEPVGSCTDISATTILPLMAEYANEYRLAPFTVLADPARAHSLLAADADPGMAFLFRKQLEEADLICLTKSDLGAHRMELPYPAVREIGAVTGQGVEAWLDEMLSGRLTAGGKVLDIDYEQYARAEAALAWLNLAATLQPRPPLSPAMLLGPLLDGIDAELTANGIPLVHLKATDDSSEGLLKAAICANGQEPIVEGARDASPAGGHELRMNLRAVGDPQMVREIVMGQVRKLAAEVADLTVACFSPSRPEPEERMSGVGASA